MMGKSSRSLFLLPTFPYAHVLYDPGSGTFAKESEVSSIQWNCMTKCLQCTCPFGLNKRVIVLDSRLGSPGLKLSRVGMFCSVGKTLNYR